MAISAKYFMGVNKGYSKKNQSDFFTCSILCVNGYHNWEMRTFYTDEEFYDLIEYAVSQNEIAVGDPVQIVATLDGKAVESVERDYSKFKPLNLNEVVSSDSKS